MLLIAAAIIYFILGEPRDGAIMLIFVIGIISIDVVQEWKTDKTLSALKDLSAPHITVIRDGKEQDIPSADLVPGDLMMICEGIKIPADGAVIRCADLCIDESSLTGEAEGVWKVPSENAEPSADYWRKDYCYAGTLVTQGTGVILVDKIGAETEYGKIGLGVAAAPQEKTPLQKQQELAKPVVAVCCLCLLVFYGSLTDHKHRSVISILSGVTLAMAMIPEEFLLFFCFSVYGSMETCKKAFSCENSALAGTVSVLCVTKPASKYNESDGYCRRYGLPDVRANSRK